MSRALRRTGRAERGSGSLVVILAVVVLTLVGVASAWLVGAIVAQRRVQAAADLAALAGAVARVRGADGCAAAAEVAARNGADLSACRVAGTDGREVVIWTRLRGPDLAGRALWLRAEARAGPG